MTMTTTMITTTKIIIRALGHVLSWNRKTPRLNIYLATCKTNRGACLNRTKEGSNRPTVTSPAYCQLSARSAPRSTNLPCSPRRPCRQNKSILRGWAPWAPRDKSVHSPTRFSASLALFRAVAIVFRRLDSRSYDSRCSQVWNAHARTAAYTRTRALSHTKPPRRARARSRARTHSR